jgi:hypothetical protein
MQRGISDWGNNMGLLDSIKGMFGRGRDTATDVAEDMADTAGEMAGKAADMAGDAAEAVGDAAAGMVDRARDLVDGDDDEESTSTDA